MSNRIIRFTSLAVLAAAALADPPAASARAEACSGQAICWLGCPSNLTLFCESYGGCTPGSHPIAVCEPDGCDWPYGGRDLVICGGEN